jgi:hypothetical protein
MNTSFLLSQQLQQQSQQMQLLIEGEIAQRTTQHRLRISKIPRGAAAPLTLLAHGDSWFDYPLSGNSVSLAHTDIIVHLESMGAPPPVILNISHWGDAATAELSRTKQQRLITALDPGNWPNGKPDAILFSGGGNDIAGDQFAIFLDYAAASPTGYDAARFNLALGMVEACYRALFDFRDQYAAGVPILGHAYDFAIPNGVHPICAGPWLLPSIVFCGWNILQGTAIVRQALTDFMKRLATLAAVPKYNFTLVPTQGVLAASDWANELHPYPQGFKNLADQFVNSLRGKFPGRI